MPTVKRVRPEAPEAMEFKETRVPKETPAIKDQRVKLVQLELVGARVKQGPPEVKVRTIN